MKVIESVKLMEATTPELLEEGLKTQINQLQQLGLEVEVNHAMCQANAGFGYKYSAVVIGRRNDG